MKVAVVHEWLDCYAGSERVLEQLLEIWPEADLFAVCDFVPAGERAFLRGKPVRTTFIQRLPFARRCFRMFLPLMPLAIEQLDLSGYDLVVSSSHAVAKGVLTGPGQLHVSYIHSPMRYAWDLQHQYLRQSGMERGLKGALTRLLLHGLRIWDRSSAAGVDVMVANSGYIADRIRKAWRREALVVHPPVDVAGFPPNGARRGDHYVVASRMVPYKRVDLVVEAFRAMPSRRLVVLGDGPEWKRVQAAAAGAPNIELRGRVPQADLVEAVRTARAFVFAAEEDFGIAMVEAQACGTPVIAYGRGGARDIVRAPPDPEPTGLFFAEQSAAAIAAAVERFEALPRGISAADCRANAQRFGRERFKNAMRRIVADHMLDQTCDSPSSWPPAAAAAKSEPFSTLLPRRAAPMPRPSSSTRTRTTASPR
ncbi:glycosyltransferase family 4 protein [Craurococcus roseus]|uniref:Glycosyltransferase family 4 protein n=1 Tax=Craurococcus roseus TaxID=77585 RepID=A0ABN1FED6_9PROT